MWGRPWSTDTWQNIKTAGLHFSLSCVLTWCVFNPVGITAIVCHALVSLQYTIKAPKGGHGQEGILQRRFSGQQTRSFGRVWGGRLWTEGKQIKHHQINSQLSNMFSTISTPKRESAFQAFLGIWRSALLLNDCMILLKLFSCLKIMYLGHKYSKFSSKYFILIKLKDTFLNWETVLFVSASNIISRIVV